MGGQNLIHRLDLSLERCWDSGPRAKAEGREVGTGKATGGRRQRLEHICLGVCIRGTSGLLGLVFLIEEAGGSPGRGLALRTSLPTSPPT